MGAGSGWGEDPNNPSPAPVDTSADSYNPYGDPNNAGVTPIANISDYIDQKGLYMTGDTNNPIYLGGGGDTLAYLESIRPPGFQGDWLEYLHSNGLIGRGSGNFWTDNLIGTLKVGALALGAYGADAALAASTAAGAGSAGGAAAGGAAGGAAAAEGAAAGAAGAGAGSAAGTSALDAYLASAGLAPGAFEGAAFTVPSALGSAGAAATEALPYTSTYDAANLYSQGLNSAAIEQNLVATGMNEFLAADMANLASQGLSAEQIASTLAASYTPAELAGTGIESLNWGAKGLSLSDVAKYADNARKVLSTGNTLSKLLSGGGGAATKTGGVNPQQLGSLLAGGTPVATDYLGQIKMNERPFFGSNEGTLGGENVYDVSGAKLANALRNK